MCCLARDTLLQQGAGDHVQRGQARQAVQELRDKADFGAAQIGDLRFGCGDKVHQITGGGAI